MEKWLRIVHEYIKEKKLSFVLDGTSEEELSWFLETLCLELRQKNAQTYSKASMLETPKTK